LMWYKKYRR